MKIKRFFSVLLAVILAVGAFALPANAISAVKDTSRDVNLTIYALEAEDGSEIAVDSTITGEKVTIKDREPIEGVSFALYKVADDEISVDIPNGVTPITTEKSDSTGAVKVTIPADLQGRYLVVQNDKPEFCKGTTVPFLVDLPRTNTDGTDFIYDVFAYPKQIVNGAVMLTKTFSGSAPDNGQVATFTLTDANGNSTDYTTDPTTGVLYINDLSFGDYTIRETGVDAPYVITDEIFNFTIEQSGCVLTENDEYTCVGNVVDLGIIDNTIPFEPTVDKAVSADGGKTYGDEANLDVYNGDVATWKITAEVPIDIENYDIFIVGDILDDRLIAPKATDIKAYVDGKSVASDVYQVTVKNQIIKVEFDTQKLSKYEGSYVQVIFSTSIDITDKDAIGNYIPNTATLTYTDLSNSTTDSDNPSTDTETDMPSTDTDISTNTSVTIITTTVRVWTGEIEGYKHDKNDKALEGAEFTLYSDKECKNVVAKTTSDKNGNFYFKGLKDGTYWLVETKAPDGYQKNDKKLEIKVDRSSNASTVKVDVLNVPIPNLPLTGGAGTIGMSLLGIVIISMGGAMIFVAIKAYRKALLGNV